jgi:hypothetical protein
MVIHPELLRAYSTARTSDTHAAARRVPADAAVEPTVRSRRRSLAATFARCVTTRPSRRPTPTSSAR